MRLEGALSADQRAAQVGLCFLPVEIFQEAAVAPPMPDAVSHIEIELLGGDRMRISGGYDPEALVRLILGLTA